MVKQFKQLDKSESVNLSAKRNSTSDIRKVLGFALTGVAMFVFSGSASAACKGVNCICVPSELEFASPVLKPNEDGEYPISLEADNV